MNNFYGHLHQPSPQGSKRAKFCLVFHSHYERSDFKMGQKIEIPKTYSTDAWALICRRPCAVMTPQLWDTFSQLGPLMCHSWKKGYIALFQLHVDRLRSDFTRWYSVSPWKLRNCENPLRVESKMADDTHILNIRTPIALKQLKPETSNLVCALTTRSTFDGVQKLGQRGCDLDFNLQTPVNISNG